MKGDKLLMISFAFASAQQGCCSIHTFIGSYICRLMGAEGGPRPMSVRIWVLTIDGGRSTSTRLLVYIYPIIHTTYMYIHNTLLHSLYNKPLRCASPCDLLMFMIIMCDTSVHIIQRYECTHFYNNTSIV